MTLPYVRLSYVANLFGLPTERLQSWRGRYTVHPQDMCWTMAILKANFRYEDQYSSVYWNNQSSWEQRTLSAIWWFLQYHLMCCFNLTEASRERSFDRIPPTYCGVELCHSFKYEQQPIFSYKFLALIDD